MGKGIWIYVTLVFAFLFGTILVIVKNNAWAFSTTQSGIQDAMHSGGSSSGGNGGGIGGAIVPVVNFVAGLFGF